MAGAELTYPDVGATRNGLLPAGYRQVHRDIPIGTGRAAFRRVADGLLRWDVHRAAGFPVTSTGNRAAQGTDAILRAGPGLLIPCRVVYTVDQADCQGFAYGTLPGHPERGEEAFLVTIAGEEVRFRIRAFSRPAWLVARLGGLFTRLAQDFATDRYVRAARDITR